ncbi:MAG: class II fructose-bisphosphate aldolase [Eubacteriales bacterium]|nr:class II fructose-bisphosphate aldolase [Eubacteriales bacterium]
MLADLKYVLKIADEGSFAVPAFNVYNMETVMGIIKAAEMKKAPVIIQSYSRLFTSGNADYLAPIVLEAAGKASIPVCFHLDHGASMAEVVKAIRCGCTGIMIDASALPVEENIRITSDAVRICGYAGIPVEGEIGHVGSVKDDMMSPFTQVAEAVNFAESAGVAAMAIHVGTAHGRYKKEPKLDISRIREIHDAVGPFLVLHGGSGIPDDQIREAIAAGIRKVNIGTDVCYAFLDRVFETSRELVAIDLFMKDAIDSVAEFAASRIDLLGAGGK